MPWLLLSLVSGRALKWYRTADLGLELGGGGEEEVEEVEEVEEKFIVSFVCMIPVCIIL